MISVHLTIQNPFHKGEDFESLFEKAGKIVGNKNWEVQVMRDRSSALEAKINTFFTGSDHAGPSLLIGLLGYSVGVRMYDSRHWDYENNTWEKYE